MNALVVRAYVHVHTFRVNTCMQLKKVSRHTPMTRFTLFTKMRCTYKCHMSLNVYICRIWYAHALTYSVTVTNMRCVQGSLSDGFELSAMVAFHAFYAWWVYFPRGDAGWESHHSHSNGNRSTRTVTRCQTMAFMLSTDLLLSSNAKINIQWPCDRYEWDILNFGNVSGRGPWLRKTTMPLWHSQDCGK